MVFQDHMPPLHVESSNYAAIQEAIASIASVVTFANGDTIGSNYSIGEVPTPDDLKKQDSNGNFIVGYPYFAVRQGRLYRFATGLSPNGEGDDNMRGMQQIEPIWDFDCYCFYPYAVDQKNYDRTAIALVTLVKVFTENYTLNGTCVLSNPHSWGLPYAQIGTQQFVAAKFTLRCYELLATQYG